MLYEALSIGKRVGRFNFEGLTARGGNPGVQDGFFYINNEKEFEKFITERRTTKGGNTYSTFDAELFKELLKRSNEITH